MTDQELADLVSEFAAIEPVSADGIAATITFAQRLEAEPEFAGQQPRTVRNASGSHLVSANFVSQRMIQIARTDGPLAAVRWFRKVPTLNHSSGGAVKALYGLKCPERIWLSENVVLLPFLELPESSMRDYVLNQYRCDTGTAGFRGFIQPPYAALYRAGEMPALTLDSNADFTASPPMTWFEELDTAALLLALVPRAIPLEAVHWVHYDDPDVAMLCQFGIGWRGSEIQPLMYIEPPLITQESVTGLCSAYKELKKSDQDRVMLALQRLIRARSQMNPGNRAIDLSIALEVLFMSEEGEHSYKIRLRAARFLRMPDNRRQVFDEVKKIYDVRSKMVHKGRVTSDNVSVNGIQRTTRDLVESVDVLCTEAIRLILERGGIPDWLEVELC